MATSSSSRSRRFPVIAWIVVLLLLGVGGLGMYWKLDGEKRVAEQAKQAEDTRRLLEQEAARAAEAKLARAAELVKTATARDQGVYDATALEMLREAKSLTPDAAEIDALIAKFSNYPRTLQVPGDFATPAEAMAVARSQDRILLASGTWKGPLLVDGNVTLQGAGAATTVVECAPESGSVFTLGPAAVGVKITGITFRHEASATPASGSERFSAVLVRGGQATFTNCEFSAAAGHGLAVTEGGNVAVSGSSFSKNGWNGASANGQGSALGIDNSVAFGNGEHGVESWAGAALSLKKSRCESNARNGVHAENGSSAIAVEGCQLSGNKEFGLVIDSASAGGISQNTARGNALGGLVIRAAAGKVAVTGNELIENQGPGLVLEKGLDATAFSNNSMSKNTGESLVKDVDLSGK